MSGKLYGVGVGPGDPELLTLKAQRILNSVQCIAVPKTALDKESLALTIAQGVIEKKTEVLELHFPMSYSAALLEESWQQAECRVIEKLDAGHDVAFITLGDPTIYSTYAYLQQALKKRGYATEVVPGVTSFCAAAARAGITLGENKETIAIIPSAYECKNLDDMLRTFDTTILMKASRQFAVLKAKLQTHGLVSNTVVVTRCGLPDEKIEFELDNVSEDTLNYLTTVIVTKGRSRLDKENV